MQRRHIFTVSLWCLSAFTLAVTLLELIPLFIALRAGIASLNIVILTPLIAIVSLLSIIAWQRRLKKEALVGITATIAGLIALAAPLWQYASVANSEQVSLSFNFSRYIKFTGDSIVPAETYAYKTVGEQELRFATYQLDTSAPRPTVLLVHGGGWQYGEYLRTNNWPKLLRDAGYQVMSIDYRLASGEQTTWDKAPKDIADAVAYIKEHADQLGVDTTRIAIFGQSAGGHLALLEAHKSRSVRAAIGLYAPTDLAADYRLSVDKDSELAFLGGSPTDQPRRYSSVSVNNAVSAASPSTLLLQGTNDNIVHFTSSTKLSERLKQVGVRHRVVLLPFTGHSFDNQVGGFPTQIAEQVTLDFLKTALQ